MRKIQPETIVDFVDHINATASGKIIYVVNNKLESHEKFTLNNSTNITHNAHGINDYADYHNYAHISAIKPHVFTHNFFKSHVGLSNHAITFVFSGNMCYQLLMRSALRDANNINPVHLFALDTQMAETVLDLFDSNFYTKSPDVPLIDVRNIASIRKKVGSTPDEQAFYDSLIAKFDALIEKYGKKVEDVNKYKSSKQRKTRSDKKYASNSEKQLAYYARKKIRQDKMYDSNAERQKAYRERQKLKKQQQLTQ